MRIVVEDTGQGISPEFLPHVFERFRQADPSTTRGAWGLGLGLSIAKHLVELHGGNIVAASDGIGMGSSVRGASAVERRRRARQLGSEHSGGRAAGAGSAFSPAPAGRSACDAAARRLIPSFPFGAIHHCHWRDRDQSSAFR